MSTPNKSANQDTVCVTAKVRLTYAFIWEARSNADDASSEEDNDKKKYSTSVLIRKDDNISLANLEKASNAAFLVGQTKGYWGANAPSNFKLPLRDGDAEAAEKGEHYMGHWFLNASSTRRPRIVDINRQDITEESQVYSGCYARVILNLFPFNTRGNKGVGCGLEAIQKLGDGEHLGTAPIDIDAAFSDWGDGSGDTFDEDPAFASQPGPAPMQQPAPVMQGQQYQQQGYPMQQVPMQGQQYQQQGYPMQQPAPAMQGQQYQQQGYPMQQPTMQGQQPFTEQQQGYYGYGQGQQQPGSILPQQSPQYPQGQAPMQQQQPGGSPFSIGGNMPDTFQQGVDAASRQMGQVFGDERKDQNNAA